MSVSLSSVVTDVKKVLADLPSLRKEAVAALAAAAAVVGIVHEAFPAASGPTQAVLASVVGAITGATTFLSDPRIVAILQDVAAAVTPKSLKGLVRRGR